MNSLMTRSFIEAMGGRLPPGIAYVLNGKPVKVEEVRQRRHKRQVELLRRKREWFVTKRVAVRVSVRFFDMDIYGGWHVYIDALGGVSEWVRSPRADLLELFPYTENWKDWKRAFAVVCQLDRFDGQPQGVAYCWAEKEGQQIVRVTEVIATGKEIYGILRPTSSGKSYG